MFDSAERNCGSLLAVMGLFCLIVSFCLMPQGNVLGNDPPPPKQCVGINCTATACSVSDQQGPLYVCFTAPGFCKETRLDCNWCECIETLQGDCQCKEKKK